MPEFARSYRTTPPSGLQDMAALARDTPGALNLGIGDPNFTTPEHIIDAAAAAAKQGFTHYAPAAGLPSLREAIANKVQIRNGAPCSPDQVTVTTGAAGGLFTAFLVILDPGDEVLIPDPGWPTYPAMVHVLNAKPIPYGLPRAGGFLPDLNEIESRITSRTKAIVIASPCNPTGVVCDETTLSKLLEIADRHGLWVLSDESYDEIILEGSHVSAAALGERDNLITVFTFSKTYAMTGWRIGYVVASREMTIAVTKAQRPVLSCTSVISQKGAEAALTGPQDAVAEMIATYQRRRRLTLDLLDAGEVGCVRSTGAFYLMADIGSATSSHEFAYELLRNDKVSVTPGSAFGTHGEGMVRISFAVADDHLADGIPKLVSAVRSAKPLSEATA